MPRPQSPTTPYANTLVHSGDSHNTAVGVYGQHINAHSHDPSDPNGYGSGIPAWGPSNPLYSLHGPGGAGSGNDWATAYGPNAAIPADPAETAVNPVNGLIMTQAAAPTSITAAHGIQAHLQRLYGVLARLKAVTQVTDVVAASPAPAYSGGIATFTVGAGSNFRVGAQISTPTRAGWVNTIVGNVITAGGMAGAPAAGETVTQRIGNWWDDVQAVLLGNTPLSGNIVLASGYAVTAPQLISNVASGTPPLIVASATKVVNLNADAVDGFSAWQTNQGGSGGLMAAPTPAPTSAAPVAGGTLTVGTSYTWGVTYQTATGETALSAASTAQVPTTTNKTVNLSAIPTGPPTVTARRIYRSANGGATWGLVGTLADNTTTTFSDTGFAAGAAPPATGTATLGAMIPALSADGFLSPGYVDYDQAEAATWDTLASGASSMINSLNRLRNQVVALLTAAGGSWGTAPAELVSSVTVNGVQAPAGPLVINGPAVSLSGNVLTIT